MGYKIMNRELTGYSLAGNYCPRYYEDNKQMHLNEKYTTYGDVLVQTKRVFSGINLKFRFYFKNHWYWKPSFHWKYGSNYFHWLFFMFWFEREYAEQFDKIIKDHLSDSQRNV
jgi:hypothetical protein